MRRELLTESKKHKAWKLLCQIPSIGPIRAAMLLGIAQTPHRSRTKRQLWTYSGLAIETHSSADHLRVPSASRIVRFYGPGHNDLPAEQAPTGNERFRRPTPINADVDWQTHEDRGLEPVTERQRERRHHVPGAVIYSYYHPTLQDTEDDMGRGRQFWQLWHTLLKRKRVRVCGHRQLQLSALERTCLALTS